LLIFEPDEALDSTELEPWDLKDPKDTLEPALRSFGTVDASEPDREEFCLLLFHDIVVNENERAGGFSNFTGFHSFFPPPSSPTTIDWRASPCGLLASGMGEPPGVLTSVTSEGGCPFANIGIGIPPLTGVTGFGGGGGGGGSFSLEDRVGLVPGDRQAVCSRTGGKAGFDIVKVQG